MADVELTFAVPDLRSCIPSKRRLHQGKQVAERRQRALQMADMLKEFERLIGTGDVSSVDRLDLPTCPERSTAIPDA